MQTKNLLIYQYKMLKTKNKFRKSRKKENNYKLYQLTNIRNKKKKEVKYNIKTSICFCKELLKLMDLEDILDQNLVLTIIIMITYTNPSIYSLKELI